MDLTTLRPVLIPSSIFSLGKWVGPYHYWSELPLSLTWAFVQGGGMEYLNHGALAALTERQLDWRDIARKNLARDSAHFRWRKEWRGSAGGLEGAALTEADGIGPSRLIRVGEVEGAFPAGGLRVYVPDRWFALVLSESASRQTVSEVEAAVAKIHAASDVPMWKEAFPYATLVSRLTAAGER